MSRSLKKWPFVCKRLLKKISLLGEWKTAVQTYSRSSDIAPEFIWKTIEVHNWRKFIPVRITENHVWYKLWEFSPTRTFKWHKK